jgi:hypothetical protein
LSEAAAGVEEAAQAGAVGKPPDDLPRIVDALGQCIGRTRHVDLGEAAAGVEEAVKGAASKGVPHNLPGVIDAEGHCLKCTGHGDLGEAPAGVKEAVKGAASKVKDPHNLLGVMPWASVATAPGTSI